VIPPGTLIVGKVKEYPSTFAAYPSGKMGIVLRGAPRWEGDPHILYDILYDDGAIKSQYEGFVSTFYEVLL
jgi:hypothetical protein